MKSNKWQRARYLLDRSTRLWDSARACYQRAEATGQARDYRTAERAIERAQRADAAADKLCAALRETP